MDQVYLARHGQTVWNVERRRQGHLDSPLTELGLAQARHIAALVAPYGVDALFASPIGRSHRTAEIIGVHLGLPVAVIDDLQEVHYGRVGGLTDAELDRDFPGLSETRRRDKFHFRFPGGESYADADVRARRALERIAGTGAQRPLIVAHEMIGRVLLKNLLNQDPATALGWNHPHDVVYRIDSVRMRAYHISVDGEVRGEPSVPPL